MMMRKGASLLFLLLLMIISSSSAADLTNTCSNPIQKLSECFAFATGKTDSPSDMCCTSVSDIKSEHPVCLCYIIQKTRSGSGQAAGIGLQYDKLVQLPSVCKIAGANISYCPALLGLKPGSPDAAIFNSSTASSTPNTTMSNTAGSSAVRHQVRVGTIAATIASAIISSMF